MIRDFSIRDYDRCAFEEEFKDWLPDKIIDSHVHLWAKDNLKISKEEYATYKVYKPWTDFDYMEEFLLEDYETCVSGTFPGKKVIPLIFGSPFPQVDRDKTNAYIIRTAEAKQCNFFYIPGQYEDMFETEKRLHLLGKRGFLGLKPYPDIPVVKGREAGIFDMLNRSALEFADKYGLYIVLHLPRKDRLRSEDNRQELIECVKTYRNAKFIIAHVGRAFTYFDVEGQIDFLLPFSNVFFDLALINSETVIEYLLRKADVSRVFFGADAPLAFSRGKDVTINNHHYYVSEGPVPWGLGPMKEGGVKLSFYMYEELRAVLYAVKAVYGRGPEAAIDKIFFENAQQMIQDRHGYKI